MTTEAKNTGDFVNTSTVATFHWDARVKTLLGWKMQVNVRTPVRVDDNGFVVPAGPTVSKGALDLPPPWWTWLSKWFAKKPAGEQVMVSAS